MEWSSILVHFFRRKNARVILNEIEDNLHMKWSHPFEKKWSSISLHFFFRGNKRVSQSEYRLRRKRPRAFVLRGAIYHPLRNKLQQLLVLHLLFSPDDYSIDKWREELQLFLEKNDNSWKKCKDNSIQNGVLVEENIYNHEDSKISTKFWNLCYDKKIQLSFFPS